MPKRGTASFTEAAKQAQVWATEVLQCRTLGHAWAQDHEHEHNGTREGRNYLVYFYCTRECGVTRVQRWTPRGLIVSSSLSYPRDADGRPTYLSEVGYIDKDARGALRLATLAVSA